MMKPELIIAWILGIVGVLFIIEFTVEIVTHGR